MSRGIDVPADLEQDKPVFKYFKCECHDPNHNFVVEYDPEYKEFAVQIHMSHFAGFFRRLWIAFKYVFKIGTTFDHYSSVHLTEEQVKELKSFLDNPNKI